MKIIGSGVALTEDMILELENQFSIKLPQDYKEFMLRYNGGKPDGNWGFDFFEKGTNSKTGSIIRYFEVLYTEETMKFDDLKAGYVALVESGQIPCNLLPIADDPFGNIIFISVKGDDYGLVYFGNHELEATETGYLVMSQIANSFTEFTEMLYICE